MLRVTQSLYKKGDLVSFWNQTKTLYLKKKVILKRLTSESDVRERVAGTNVIVRDAHQEFLVCQTVHCIPVVNLTSVKSSTL